MTTDSTGVGLRSVGGVAGADDVEAIAALGPDPS